MSSSNDIIDSNINSNINSQLQLSGPPSPVSSTDLSPTVAHSPISSAKRARETSVGSDVDDSDVNNQQQLNRPLAIPAYDSDDEQLESAVAGWDCNDRDTSTTPEISNLPPAEQIDHIESLKNSNLVDGAVWYLVANAWISRWKQYCKRMSSPMASTQLLGSQTFPVPVDNSSILNEKSQLLPHLADEQDFICVPELAWFSLEKWYGVSDTPISRYVITDGTFIKNTVIEIYPPTFKAHVTSPTSLEKSPVITLSRATTVKDMKSTLLNAFDLAQDKDFALWRLNDDLSPTLDTPSNSPSISSSALHDAEKIDVADDDKTLCDLSLASGTLVLEFQTNASSFMNNNTNGGFIRRLSNASSTSSTSGIFGSAFNNMTSSVGSPPFSPSSSTLFNNGINDSQGGGDSGYGSSWLTKNAPVSRQKGTCGLSNLGNTCFMNSALQCLSNTPQLTQWFLAGKYKEDLNKDNPLGMNGEVAENYGALIEKLWSGTTASVAPRDFKYTISRFNPTFNGYQQHDSQELLAFLLDGLHEDMNRILKKPYIEMPDFVDMTDEEIAKQSWDYHKARNDSVIVDLFQGQFKSRLICNVCHKVSVTFDPFMYLSLPLPIQKKRKTKLVYVPYDPSLTPQRMVITLDKDASFKHLKDAVAKQVGVDDSSTLLITEIFNHKVYKVFPDYELIASIGTADEIYVYQLPGPVPSLPTTKRRQPRFSIRSRLGSSAFDNMDDSGAHDDEDFDGEKWIVFPVYCASTPDPDSQYRMEQFGGPVLLAIQAKDATSPENVYRLIAKHVERYTVMKLFEEVRRPSQVSVADDVNAPLSPTSPPTGQENEIENNMEIDNVEQQQPKLIRTAAAVTAAGGRQLEPISNLFSMKIFSENSYGSAFDELIPTGITSWRSGSLEDLKERFEKETAERHAYEKAKLAPTTSIDDDVTDDESMNDTTSPAKDTPPIDDCEDDVVADVALEWNQNDTEMTLAPTATLSGMNGDSNEDNGDSDATSDATSDNNSLTFESSSSSTKPQPNSALATQSPSSPLSPITTSPPHQPAAPPRCPPPRTVIRQGEGILLDWRLKKAQELFGTKQQQPSVSTYGNTSCDVNEYEWTRIDEEKADPSTADAEEKERKKQVTLMDCMDEFTKEEQLSEEDLWYCPQCKEHQRATKKFDIWHLPEIMVVHLKRFSHTRTLRDKIDALIDFPMEELDMTDRVLGVKNPHDIALEDRFIYDLYAVDNHFGGMGGGHYTAYAQNWQDGEWYNFDDSHVTKVEQKDAKTNAAYLLFYKRRRQQVATDSEETATDMKEDTESP
ncbi:unnamed protein product [Absidia cylindrospora]